MYKLVAYSLRTSLRNGAFNATINAKAGKLAFSNLKLCCAGSNSSILSNRFDSFSCLVLQHVAYSTEVADSSVKEIDGGNIADVDLEKINLVFPQPKATLHNCMASVSQQLQKGELKLQPVFKRIKQGKAHVWQCTYGLRWPEDVQFSHTSVSKSTASSRAALAALSYLKKSGKIDKDGLPIVYDKSNVRKLKQAFPALDIQERTLQKLEAISTIYRNRFMPLLVDDVKDEGDVEMNRSLPEEVERVKKGRAKQRFQHLDLYTAKEPVKLPISDYKEEIAKLVRDNQVVIVKGEPGCGKSTRVPQYILESWAWEDGSAGEPCNIVVTQPRRIAAISLAERVANERNERVGATIGYQVRLQSNVNPAMCRILYCTTGILLRRLQSDPTISDCTHVILDEAHERDVNTDLLMNLLRRAIELNPKLKLLIMSATIDTEMFQRYFDGAPLIHIPGFTYPVEQHFLDDLDLRRVNLAKTKKMCETQAPSVICEDVASAINHLHETKPDGAILCFLPGWEEIALVRRLLESNTDLEVLCLHSRLQVSDQRKVFQRATLGRRKVILATNIAETSVTIDDIVYVVDTGIHKEQRFDVAKGVMCIDNHWVSQASVAQRKGRAGRCQAGESFHLFPREKYEQFIDYSVPEILRTSLTKIVLDTKVFSNNMNAVEFLEQLICPPDESSVMKAVAELKELEMLDDAENLTPLGRTVANFQLPPKLSKAMVNSVIFKCATPIVDIATLFSADSEIFSSGLVDKQHIKGVKKEYSDTSDHLAFMRLFEKWLELAGDDDYSVTRDFCFETGLVPHKMKTLEKLRTIHFEYLYKGLSNILPITDDNSDNDELVKAVLLSGVGCVMQHRNWDIVKGKLKKVNVLLTTTKHKAAISSSSVHFKRGHFPSDFFVYINETLSTMRHMSVIREASLISPVSVVLFKSNAINIEELDKAEHLDTIDSDDQVLLRLHKTKIAFKCDRKQALVLKECKECLQGAVQYYIYQLTSGNENNEKINRQWEDMLDYLCSTLRDCLKQYTKR